MGNHMLHLARMLGGRDHPDLVVLPRQGERDVALQVEVVLPADPQRALQAARRGVERGLDVASRERQGFGHGLDRILRLDDCPPRLIGDPGAPRGPPGLGPRFRDDREHGLAIEGHDAVREDGIVACADRAYVVFARDVGGRQHADHARRAQDFREVQLRYAGVSDCREPEAAVQHAGGLHHVVGIGGEARHMLGGRVVPVRAVHMFADRGAGHGETAGNASR